jgi:hypothetical protein
MITTLEVSLMDDKWPKLRIVCRRQTSTGETTITTLDALYDGAYVMFEAQLQNHLRPMVEELIRRRKGLRQPQPQTS